MYEPPDEVGEIGGKQAIISGSGSDTFGFFVSYAGSARPSLELSCNQARITGCVRQAVGAGSRIDSKAEALSNGEDPGL
jgi:hypothetical protein